MENVTFYSYKPYLFIGIQRENGISVTFSAECTYSPTNEEELQCLREYALQHPSVISESMAPEELKRRYTELEEKAIQEAEARAAAKVAEKKEHKERHEFYRALRFSDQVCR